MIGSASVNNKLPSPGTSDLEKKKKKSQRLQGIAWACQQAKAVLGPLALVFFFIWFVFLLFHMNEFTFGSHTLRNSGQRSFATGFQVHFQENKYFAHLNDCESYVVSTRNQ